MFTSQTDLLAHMRQKLGRIMLDFEIQEKAKIAFEIIRLKVDRNAVILGHNYMEPALYHSIPDIVGDSLGLCREAAKTDKDIIVFCGVQFMAETAKILNPSKKVLIPSQKAGCSLAAAITAEDVRNLRKAYPGVPIVTYINTYADVKAEVDICCTSGNAHKVVHSLNASTVIFLPDQYLATNVARDMGRDIYVMDRDKLARGDFKKSEELPHTVIAWNGKCEVHDLFRVEDISEARKQFPQVEVIAHPECRSEVVEASDYSGSTTQMIDHVKHSGAQKFLLLTECSMGDNIIADNPEKDLVRLCSHRCPHMHQITLEDTLKSLQELRYEVTLPEDLRLRAFGSIERMLNI